MEKTKTKLNDFLGTNEFQHEKDVIYFLVESRKILDRMRDNGENGYNILRFYCDWALHTNKTKITPEIRVVMDDIWRETLNTRELPKALVRFINMKDLKKEIFVFCKVRQLPNDAFRDEAKWAKFCSLLIKILSDQPILLSNPGMKSFRLTASKDTFVVKYDYDLIP